MRIRIKRVKEGRLHITTIITTGNGEGLSTRALPTRQHTARYFRNFNSIYLPLIMAARIQDSSNNVSVCLYLLSHTFGLRTNTSINVKVLCIRRNTVPTKTLVVIRVEIGNIFHVRTIKRNSFLPRKGNFKLSYSNGETRRFPGTSRVLTSGLPVLHGALLTINEGRYIYLRRRTTRR